MPSEVTTPRPLAASEADNSLASPVEALRPFISLWVAVRNDEVLVAAPSPREIVAWLAQHRQRASQCSGSWIPSRPSPARRRTEIRVPVTSCDEWRRLTPCPVVDIALEGLEAAPMTCLLDTGALRTRMSSEIASIAGVELPGALTEQFYIGG